MSGTSERVLVAYAELEDLYRRQFEILASSDPDLDALDELLSAADGVLAGMPRPGDWAPDPAATARLTEAAAAADRRRRAVAERLAAMGDGLLDRLRIQHRRERALRAYRRRPGDPPRFLDQSR